MTCFSFTRKATNGCSTESSRKERRVLRRRMIFIVIQTGDFIAKEIAARRAIVDLNSNGTDMSSIGGSRARWQTNSKPKARLYIQERACQECYDLSRKLEVHPSKTSGRILTH